MKKFNRILALLLVIVFSLSLFTTFVSADDADATADTSTTASADTTADTETSDAIGKKIDSSLFEKSSNYTVSKDFTKVASNGNLEFYLNYSNGEYALHNKEDDSYFFSTPLDVDKDTFGSGTPEAKSLMSVFFITSTFSEIELTSADAKIITEKYGDSQVVSFFFDTENSSFIIPVMFTLHEDYLEVELLIDSINEMSDSRILEVSLMQVFGAGNPKDEGYILLPDGMGSLAGFNENFTNVDGYKGYVYGRDPTSDAAINEWNYGKDLTESVRMPIYGIKKNDSAFLSIMTQSEANVTLKAYVAGMKNSYNFIYPTVTLRNSQTRRTSTGTSGAGVYYSDTLPENFKLRIYPLTGSEADYVGMAEKYREYLTEEVKMQPLSDDAGTPMNVTLIGAYKRTKHFLGIPYTGLDTMTTFDQASDILTDLNEKGVDNMICGMIGWNSGGLEDAVSTEFNPEKELGGEKGAQDLMNVAEKLDVSLMFDVDLVKFHKASGKYTKFDSTVYGLDLAPIAMFPFIVSVNRVDKERTPHYLFHPTAMTSVATSFVNSASGAGIKNYSFSSVGADPYAAYNHDDVSTRDNTVNVISNIFSNVAKADKSDLVTTSVGNAFVFPYVNNVVDAPIYSSHMYFAREEVPFYYIAFRGLTRLSGPALNLSAETEDVILRSAQYGVGLYAVLSNESSSNLKDTSYNYYYSTEYALLGQDIADAYNRLSVVYDAVGNATITDFEVITDTLKVTTFANGAKVYVNYGDIAATHKNVKIPASDFVVVGGDK